MNLNRIRTMLKGLLLISVLLVARTDVSSGFLVNPGDASELLAEFGQLKEAVSTLTNQVRSSCGCASTLAPRCPDGWIMFDKSCYYFGVVPKTWQDAEVACERLSGHLATVHSAEEEKFILDYVKRERNDLVDLSHGYTWIGGHDFLLEDKWMWITDEHFNYTNWRAGNPNNGRGGNGNEDCLDVSLDGWNDNVCSSRLNYVCERKTFY